MAAVARVWERGECVMSVRVWGRVFPDQVGLAVTKIVEVRSHSYSSKEMY